MPYKVCGNCKHFKQQGHSSLDNTPYGTCFAPKPAWVEGDDGTYIPEDAKFAEKCDFYAPKILRG